MKDDTGPSREALLKGHALVRTVQAAESVDAARATILATIVELTRADFASWIERDARGELSITRRAGAVKPSLSEDSLCLTDAREALGRYDERRQRAARSGREVRNPGTDDTPPISTTAKVIWSGDQLYGAVAIARRGIDSFTEVELALFKNLAESAATGLAKRHVQPPGPPAHTAPALKAALEEKRLPTRRFKKNELERILALAREGFLGEGDRYIQILRTIAVYAPGPIAILIQGESGTGKEQCARLVHRASDRAGGPFVAVNAGALPKDLVESHLFGHVKGAFTGAISDAVGQIRSADGGTLFLDEIGELSLDGQVKLLRVLQEKAVTPVGSSKVIPVDFRLVAATNRRLEEHVAAGTFREDLLYRLCGVPIDLPALRDRIDELPVFVEHFIAKASPGMPRLVEPATWAVLRGHTWPGNLRELETVIGTAVIAAGADRSILPQHLRILRRTPASSPAAPAPSRRAPLTRAEVDRALEAHGGNRSQAARALGVDRRTLQRVLERG